MIEIKRKRFFKYNSTPYCCVASYANALIEFDRVPMAIREFQKLRALGEKSEEVDVSFHLYEAARMLIDSINL